MGGKAFKKRLVHSFVLIIIFLVPLLESFIANVPKCKTYLKTKFKCVCITSDKSLLTCHVITLKRK